MDAKKFGLILAAMLMLMVTALAAPAVTATTPGTLTNDSTATLTFTLKDENPDANWANNLKIYYSTTSGGFQHLIVNDTNIANGLLVDCAVSDSNLLDARTCTYAWTVPSNATMPTGYWYIDYNFIPTVPGTTGYTASTTVFKVETITGCATMIWTFGLIALVLAAFGCMRLLQGNMDVKTLAAFAMTVIIALVIITQFMQGVCVIV